MKTRAILATAALIIGSETLCAQVVTFGLLNANGILTVTVPSNSVYSVEWSRVR